MHFAAILASASTLLMTVSAVGVVICHDSPWVDCTTINAGSGQCIWVGDHWNDHVYAAHATSNTNHCDSYANVNNGACDDMLVQGIDQAGYSGLPDGQYTSGFVCYA